MKSVTVLNKSSREEDIKPSTAAALYASAEHIRKNPDWSHKYRDIEYFGVRSGNKEVWILWDGIGFEVTIRCNGTTLKDMLKEWSSQYLDKEALNHENWS